MMTEEICPICASQLSGTIRLKFDDISLLECHACHSWICLPRLDAKEQIALHNSSDYYDSSYYKKRRNETSIEKRCRSTFQRIENSIPTADLQDKKMLDIGCHSGTFLEAAQKLFGILPTGIDVSGPAIKEAQKKGIKAFECSIESMPQHLKDFSLITAIDLIEHTASPEDFFHHAYNRLSPDGVIYLEMPNIHAAIYSIGKNLYRLTGNHRLSMVRRLFPRQHAQHFTQNSIQRLARRCNFDVLQVGTRRLPFENIAASLPVRLGIWALQFVDSCFGENMLIYILLRKTE